MPPKTKSKKAAKGKSPAVVDGLSTDEMSKDQLEEHIVRLREELDREREERSYFQLERDKIQAFWEISKRSLEETKAKIRNRHREREEAEERHRVEITEYKQKLKHVLFEHQNTISEMKTGRVISTSLIQNQHTQSELKLRREVHGLQVDLREKKLHNENLITELDLKHQVELIELRNDYGRRVMEIEAKYDKTMQSMKSTEKKRLEAEADNLRERLQRQAVTLKEDQTNAFKKAEEYFSFHENKLVEDQKSLKMELAKLTKLHAQVKKELSAAEQKNKHLRESLQEAEEKLPELQQQLEEYNQAKDKETRSRARLKVIDKELRDLTMEHEMLLQAFEKVQQERDDLLKKQREAILDMQQKSGLKEMLLEKKLAALTGTVEKTEAQLCTALASSNVDQTAGSSATNKLEEVLESKQVAISALQSDLAGDCKEYDLLLQTCKEKLKAFSVPQYDLPFRPSQQILWGTGPPSNTEPLQVLGVHSPAPPGYLHTQST
uniref:dynein regulatory complex subunit 4-like isoform X2 n=1 Tax=Epinephelus lanceolatus TaxID=310571 RepID=UPI001445AE86|nr:dynein regulatory complex subunit 4-like isoform X2 [Epinephelus lanceolatus]